MSSNIFGYSKYLKCLKDQIIFSGFHRGAYFWFYRGQKKPKPPKHLKMHLLLKMYMPKTPLPFPPSVDAHVNVNKIIPGGSINTMSSCQNPFLWEKRSGAEPGISIESDQPRELIGLGLLSPNNLLTIAVFQATNVWQKQTFGIFNNLTYFEHKAVWSQTMS